MSTIIGWAIRFLGPGLLKSILDAVPKDSGTLLTTFLLILGAILNLVVQALAGKEITETEFTATAAAIGFAIQQYFVRRGAKAAEVEAKDAKAIAAVAADQAEAAKEVAAVAVQQASAAKEAAVQTVPLDQAKAIAADAVEKTLGPDQSRKPGGSGRF